MHVPVLRPMMNPLQIGKVVLNFLRRELSEPWANCTLNTLEA